MGDTGYKSQPYQDENGEWRWRRIAGNNRIVAVSGEGYEHWQHAVEQVKEFFPDDVLDHTMLPAEAGEQPD